MPTLAASPTETPSRSFIPPRAVRSLQGFDQYDRLPSLRAVGIDMDETDVRKMMRGMGADSAVQNPQLGGNLGTPIQFLQAWLNGWVTIVTAPQQGDNILGVQTVGDWEDEEVVQGILEMTGKPVPYGDYTTIPLASYNANYERRTIVRFEEGLRVGVLEERRGAKVNINSAATKRNAAALALNLQRNAIAFFGYNAANQRTYGILNDPNLPGYVTVATGQSGFTTWSTKTYLEIQADIRAILNQIVTQSGGRFDPDNGDAFTLVIPTNVSIFLSVQPVYGAGSVRSWFNETFPGGRIITAPEFNTANGGASAFYAYAESDRGDSTDDGKTWAQLVPSKFFVVGAAREAKSYVEDYSNATAGALLKRPLNVARRTGI